MQQHGPTDLTGPVRGTRGWWQGLGEEPLTSADDHTERTPPASTKPTRRGKRRSDRAIPPDRQQLIDRVRAEIAAGTYDSPERWEAALDRLLDGLERE